MSNYIRKHPEEAYRDELRCLIKAFDRRKTPAWKRWLILTKVKGVYFKRTIKF